MKEKPQGKTQRLTAVRCSGWLGVKDSISQKTHLALSLARSSWNYRRRWASLHLRKFGINCRLCLNKLRILRAQCRAFFLLLVIRLKCWPYGKEVWTYFSGGRSVKDKFLYDIEMLNELHKRVALTPNETAKPPDERHE